MANFFKPQAKKTHLNKTTKVKIKRLDMNGDGVTKWQNKPLFVSGVLPEEIVDVKIIEEKSKYLRGKALSITKPNMHRVTPRCNHYYQCGGCDLQHMAYQEQLAYKQQKVTELFKRNAQLENLPWQPPLIAEPFAYRRKARIGVQYNKLNEAIVGFRLKNSNILTNIKTCPILPDVFSSEFVHFRLLIDSFQVKKSVSHIEIIDAKQPWVILRFVNQLKRQDKQKLLEFASNKPYQIAIQDDNKTYSLDGHDMPFLSYEVEDCQLQFSPSDFVQVNELLNTAMINQAMSWLALENTDNVADLFCGLGNFSLPIAKKVNTVVGVEGVDEMVTRAQQNAKVNGIDNTNFYQADLNAEQAHWVWWNNEVNKVLIDPARAGAFNAVKNIAAHKVDKLLYISCDPATMARDAKILLEQGYDLVKLSIMDMFSQTRHVEAMALFSKK